MTVVDPSAVLHDPKWNTERDFTFRRQMDRFWSQSVGSNVEKLENFAKYVPRQVLTRFLAKYEIFKRILNVHGSVIEGGVCFGGGLMTWAQLSAILEPVNYTRRIVGFDTFAGFPQLTQEDGGSTAEAAQVGGLAVDSYDDIQRAISLYDDNRFLSHIEKVTIVKGDVSETLPRFVEQWPHLVVSLLYLDFDIFEPTRLALELLVPRMPKGAVLAFDELHAASYPGETLAVLQQIGIRNLRIQRFDFEPGMSFAVLE